MRISTVLATILSTLLLAACSSIDIEPTGTEQFTAGNYTYYRWRSEPLPAGAPSSDRIYVLDPALRRQVDAKLAAKGYVLDASQAQFTVDYIFGPGLVEGQTSELASNISHLPSVTPNRQVDQASVDNAIALGGVKETSNIVLQFNDSRTNKEVWHVTLSKIVENANRVDTSELDRNLDKYIERALQTLPPAAPR